MMKIRKVMNFNNLVIGVIYLAFKKEALVLSKNTQIIFPQKMRRYKVKDILEKNHRILLQKIVRIITIQVVLKMLFLKKLTLKIT